MRKMTRKERLLTARLEALLPDWRVMPCNEAGDAICFELEAWSPAGEDVIISLCGDTIEELAHDAQEAWDGFDPEEHAAEILVAKRAGDENARRFYAAAPDSLRDLLEDAEAIDAMYKGVCESLNKHAA